MIICLCGSKRFKNKNPKIKVIVGGPHPRALPQAVASHKLVDIVVTSEGEVVINHILNAIENETSLQSIEGVCFKMEDGSIYTSPKASLIEDLNLIPELDFGLLPGDASEYHYYLESGRGCPYNCSFCANPMLWEIVTRMSNLQRIWASAVLW